MAKGKGKGKDAGAGQKPETMTDEMWALFNNPTDLIQNLRGTCVFNTINCTISKAQAALFLWQHSATSVAKRDEIVQLGAVPQAMGAFKSVEEHERAPCVGLLHCLSACEASREQLTNTKATPPHPPIALIPMLWECLNTNSTATEVGVVGTLCNLAEDPDTRSAVNKILTSDPVRIVNVMHNSLSAQARSDAALTMKRCCTPMGSDLNGADPIRLKLVDAGAVETCVHIFDKNCSECTSSVKAYTVLAIEHSAGFLHKLLFVGDAKQRAIDAGCVDVLSRLISNKYTLPTELTLQAKAFAAGCLCMLTVPKGFQNDMMDTISQYVRMLPAAGGQSNTASTPPPPSADDPLLASMGATPLASGFADGPPADPQAQQNTIVAQVASQLEQQVKLVADAGAIPALVNLCKGPGGDDAPAGKKKKGKKEPPLPPGMAEAQASAAGCLRHLSLFEENRKAMVASGAVPIFAKLLESKQQETRMHAQGTLLNLGADDATFDPMVAAKVPEHIQQLSSPTRMMKQIREAQEAAAAKAEG